MANTFKFGNGNWAVKDGYALAYNDENNNFKPLPFDFTRASSATTLNRQGLIETVGSGKPRIDFTDNTSGHLLLEPSRMNKLLRSNEFNTTWTLGSALNLTSGQTSALTGNNNAWLLSSNGSSGFSALTQNVSFSGEHTYSIFAKEGTNDKISLRSLSGTDARAEFNLNTGSLVTTSNTTSTKIQNYGNGWYRVSMTFTATNTNVYVYPNPIGTADGGNIYIQNSQLEAGSYATSYIPTEGSGVTRLVDSCLKENLPNDVINASYPFTMYVEGTYNGQLSTLLSFLNKDASNQFFLIYINNNEVLLSARSNGTIERIESGINLIKGQKYKIAVTMNSTTSGKICVNGNSVTVKNNFSSQIQNSNITDLLIGQERIVSDGGVRSSVSGVKLYNTALSDSELQALTS